MTNKQAHTLIQTLLSVPIDKNSKLEHARKQTLKNASVFIESYNDKLEDLNIEFCSTDERGNILRDHAGQYLFTKENQKLLIAAVRNFMNSEVSTPFEVASTSDTRGLSDEHVDLFRDAGMIRG